MWKPARYSRHRSPAPPQAGTSAPPASVPDPLSTEPVSERSATKATMVSPANTRTLGLVSTRRTTEGVSGIGISSSGSSMRA